MDGIICLVDGVFRKSLVRGPQPEGPGDGPVRRTFFFDLRLPTRPLFEPILTTVRLEEALRLGVTRRRIVM